MIFFCFSLRSLDAMCSMTRRKVVMRKNPKFLKANDQQELLETLNFCLSEKVQLLEKALAGSQLLKAEPMEKVNELVKDIQVPFIIKF